MIDDSVPAPPGPRYIADEIILYGIDLNDAKGVAHLDVGLVNNAELQVKLDAGIVAGYTVLAYGYAFEGHCYRLDSVRIFIITGPIAEKAVGCCFDDELRKLGYKMWRITASEQILEISTSFGNARTLILESQLPGKRSPSSYAITLRMAHRNGRLTNE
ncbi:UNVERIFIED_ORG: hypothetical protein M2312_003052 [Rhizobium esperanzae]|uniref:Uncharacterized protein n=1 Tax=Rhizobium phaseoli TaxID=396 RepID=A0A192TIV3_9HYPH|nr:MULTISPECIES: hypothetical protein [Rhizobium]MDH6648396.1 hypothetical protein [Rhizobium esperanzae]ANL43192.1 hypothetical protein AMC88_PB00116 [Rhizobium phaseoli]ANL56191.1 hypothetical protein AMC86_PC00116 [Rhizobium phaseoli]ANL62178.1 hypothetical protein AMC85_PB00116 [Rhizobium phaseoli]ANL87591.1 hypothetical protein AMC81_PC00116 [Rhizobium phaseoli]